MVASARVAVKARARTVVIKSREKSIVKGGRFYWISEGRIV
jgi:hypothetical protein